LKEQVNDYHLDESREEMSRTGSISIVGIIEFHSGADTGTSCNMSNRVSGFEFRYQWLSGHCTRVVSTRVVPRNVLTSLVPFPGRRLFYMSKMEWI